MQNIQCVFLEMFNSEIKKILTSFTKDYAEYYIIGGWLSLVSISIFLGVLLRRLWTWFLWRQYEPLAQSFYLLNATYLYVVVSIIMIIVSIIMIIVTWHCSVES